MIAVREGIPIVLNIPRRKPLYDKEIKAVAGMRNKYLHVDRKTTREVIRQRAILMGYSVKTMSDPNGGWNILIENKENVPS